MAQLSIYIIDTSFLNDAYNASSVNGSFNQSQFNRIIDLVNYPGSKTIIADYVYTHELNDPAGNPPNKVRGFIGVCQGRPSRRASGRGGSQNA